MLVDEKKTMNNKTWHESNFYCSMIMIVDVDNELA